MADGPGFAPRRQRADAAVSISAVAAGGPSRIGRIAESGSARVRVPRHPDGVLEAVLINTGGGVASGDRFATDVEVGPDASLAVTTVAAEKVYRSDGALAAIETRIRVAAGGAVEWLPQEAILFDRARLRRRLDVELAGDASALLFEATVFGREARGERVTDGFLEDRWRIRRAGRLVYADTLRLSGPIADRLAHPAVAGGGRALATALYVAPDAERRLEEARDALAASSCECGASGWNGMLAIRWLSADIGTLRQDAARFMVAFRGRPMPRVWTC